MLSRSEQFHVVTGEALSHLALTQFMAGREGVCVDLAGQALGACATPIRGGGCSRCPSGPVPRGGGRCGSPDVQSAPWPGQGRSTAPTRWCQWPPPGGDDLAGRFWHRILLARLALVSGAVSDAVHYLQLPFEMPGRWPPHLEVSLPSGVERALHALTMGNREGLRACVERLRRARRRG